MSRRADLIYMARNNGSLKGYFESKTDIKTDIKTDKFDKIKNKKVSLDGH